MRETIIIYDANGGGGIEQRKLQQYISKNKLPEKQIILASGDLFTTLIEQIPNLAIVLINQSLNTSPYREIAKEQQMKALEQLKTKSIPHELIDGDVLTPTVQSVLQQ